MKGVKPEVESTSENKTIIINDKVNSHSIKENNQIS